MNGRISLILLGNFDVPGAEDGVLNDENSSSYIGLSLVPMIVK